MTKLRFKQLSFHDLKKKLGSKRPDFAKKFSGPRRLVKNWARSVFY